MILFEETRMPRLTVWWLVPWINLNDCFIWQRNSSMSVDKMLINFLWMVGYNASNRDGQKCFQHSGRTITRTFMRVLYALLRLYDDFVKPPGDEVPSQLTRTDQNWNKLREFYNI